MKDLRINIITEDLPEYPKGVTGIVYYKNGNPHGRIVIERTVPVADIMNGVRHVWEPVDVVIDGVYQK